MRSGLVQTGCALPPSSTMQPPDSRTLFTRLLQLRVTNGGLGRIIYKKLDYKLSANQRDRHSLTISGEFFNLPVQLHVFTVNKQQTKNCSRGSLPHYTPKKRKRKRRSSSGFCVFMLSVLEPLVVWKTHKLRRDVWGRLLSGKEIPSTAPTSVCPCLSKRPARWLMEPTYVTNISIPKFADRYESCRSPHSFTSLRGTLVVCLPIQDQNCYCKYIKMKINSINKL